MTPKPDNTPDSETVRTLRTVAHMTGSFMAANIAAYYSATAHLQGHATQSFLFGLVGLVPVGYGLWYTLENQTHVHTFYEAEHFLAPDIDTGTNQTGSNQPDPPAAPVGCSPRSAIADAVVDAVRNVKAQPTVDDPVTSDSSQSARHIPLGATTTNPRTTTRPHVAERLAPLARHTLNLAFHNTSTTIGTVVIGSLIIMAVFA